MSKYDIRPQYECQYRIWNVKIQYKASVRTSKYDIECQNMIFGVKSNVKIGLISNFKIGIERPNNMFGLISNVKIGFLTSKYDFWP